MIPPPEAPPAGGTNQPVRILLVEDNPGDARLLLEALTEDGTLLFHLDTAQRLAEAQDPLSRGEADVVLLDLSLPDASGLATVTQALAVAPEVPIIVLTGLDDGGLALRAVQSGAEDYLVKGKTEPGLLVRSIRYAIERKRAAKALRLAKEQHEALLNNIPDIAWLKGTDWRYIAVNEAFAVATGFSRDRAVGKTDFELFPRSMAERHLAQDEQIRHDGERLVVEDCFEYADGRTRWVEAIKTPFRSTSGEFAGIVGIARDVTARRRAEHGQRFLAEAGRQLASSLDYEMTLRNVANLAVSFVADFCVVDIVEQERQIRRLEVAHSDPGRAQIARELLEYPLDRSRPYLMQGALELGHAELIPEVTAEFLESMAQGPEHLRILQGLNARSLIVIPMIARSRVLGALFFASSDPHRRYDSEDFALAQELGRLSAFAIDNAHLYRQAQDATRLRDEVLGMVTHDLRNPLNSISMSAYLLKDTELPLEDRGKAIEHIQGSVERMDHLIQDLLDVTQMEAGGLRIEPEAVLLHPIIAEAEEMLSAAASQRGIKLDTAVADLDLTITADRSRILQVLSNLVGNAIKFTPAGGTVQVRVEAASHAARFSVSDTGPGIAPEDIPHIFDRFWQAKQSRRGGAGLGLAIAKGIVEAHGGRIWVESKLGVGSTFFFAIPRS